MLNICLVVLLLFSMVVVCAMLLQKEIFTQLLLLNTSTSLISLFICFLGSYKFNNSYVDIALIYFLLSFVGNLAYLKFFLQKHQKKLQNEH